MKPDVDKKTYKRMVNVGIGMLVAFSVTILFVSPFINSATVRLILDTFLFGYMLGYATLIGWINRTTEKRSFFKRRKKHLDGLFEFFKS
jgi:hypothetical protein